MIKKERQRMMIALKEKKIKSLSSQGNFLFFPAERYIFDYLSKKGILIRDFGGELEGYYRLTIGTPEENNLVLKAIGEVQNETS